MRGHQEYTVPVNRGLYRRLIDESVFAPIPQGFLYEAINVIYDDNAVRQRGGVAELFDAPAQVLRFHRFPRIGFATKYIVLCSDGNVYDSDNFGVPILTGITWIDFSGITLYNRFYFCGHDLITGVSGSFLYVYTGSAVARKAAGLKPASAVTAAVSATAGNVELGNRIYYVAYETDTGHITKPNATGTILNTNTASRSVDLSNIPTGPAGTAKRHLLCTKRTDPYTGRPDDYEVFFIPNGIINDNTATTLTVNFFDADLVDSADYLFDELEEVGAGLALSSYSGRLCITSLPTETGVVRVSKSGFPESFSSVDGFVLVDPSDDGNVRALLPQNGNLYCFKDNRTHVTVDNGDEPAHWPVNQIDSGLGSCVFGVAKILDSEGPSEDVALVATRAGLYLFSGKFAEIPLNFNIDALWDPGSLTEFRSTQVLVNPIDKLIYMTVGGTDQYFLEVGNYKNGMTSDGIRWAQYTYSSGVPFKTLGMYFSGISNRPHLMFAGLGTEIFYQGYDNAFEDSSTTSTSATFTLGHFVPFMGLSHIVGVRASIMAPSNIIDGAVIPLVYKDKTGATQLTTIVPPLPNGYKTILCNLKCNAFRIGFKLHNPQAGATFAVTFPIGIYHRPIGSGGPV